MNPPEPERVFKAPWEAQAFALAVKLNDAGVFTWDEWAAALGAAIARAKAAGDPDTGEHYYAHWLAALEQLVLAKSLAEPEQLAMRRAAWARAMAATPHGEPVLLANDPQAQA